MPATTGTALGGPVATQQKQQAPLPSGITVQELKQMTAMRMAQHQELQRQAQTHQGPAPPGFAAAPAPYPFTQARQSDSPARAQASSLAPAPPAPAPAPRPAVLPSSAPASPDRVVLLAAPEPLVDVAPLPTTTAAPAAAATARPPLPPAPAPAPSLEHFTKPNNDLAQANSSIPPMPHGLTVQELKELTRMRLAREAGIVASYQAAAAAASAAATLQPSTTSSASVAGPQGAIYQPPPGCTVGAAGASALSGQLPAPSELRLPEPGLMAAQQPSVEEKAAASMIRMYGMEVAPLPLRDPSPSSSGFLRRPSPPLSSSFPPVTTAGLLFETSLAQNVRVSRGLNPLGLGREGGRRALSMEGDEPYLMYAPPPGLGHDDALGGRNGRLTTPMQHIRPPQPIRSGSGDLVMNPIRKSSSQSSDLEAMSRQMAEYVLLTPKSPHTSILAGDPFGAAAAILQQQREAEQRGTYQYRVVRSPSGELAASLAASGRPPLRRPNPPAPSGAGMRPGDMQRWNNAFSFDDAAMRRHLSEDECAVPTPPAADSSEDEEHPTESGLAFTDGMSPTVRHLESILRDELAARPGRVNGFMLGAGKVSVEALAEAQWRGR